MKFVLASHNHKKLAEMQEILRELGVEVVLQSDVGLDLEPEENGVTFAENAAIKAMAVMQASGLHHRMRLEAGIFLEGGSRLLHVYIHARLGLQHDIHPQPGEDVFHLRQLMGVLAG